MTLPNFTFFVLAVLVFCSALLVIQNSYQSRVLVGEYWHQNARGDLLAAQQERLQLDYAWWAGQTRVDRDARKLLGMVPVAQVEHLNLSVLAK